jgi:hypothetical protein
MTLWLPGPLMFAISKTMLYNSPGILTEHKKRPTKSPKIGRAEFLPNDGGLKLKNAPDFKEHPIFLIALLLACTVFFASCSGDTSSSSSPTPPASNTQTSAITPIGALATCLTVNSPSLVKLADGNYKLVDEIDNCSGKDAGPLKITTHIVTKTTKQSTNLMGPATIPAHGKAMYHTFTGQTSRTNKEIHFHFPSSPSAIVTVSVTINGAVQGEWDGQVTIPA